MRKKANEFLSAVFTLLFVILLILAVGACEFYGNDCDRYNTTGRQVICVLHSLFSDHD